jgi:cytochrome oxidase assembly protein ShyY1
MAGHALAAFMAVLFVALGFWQLARNHHKHQLVERDKAAYASPAQPVTGVTAVNDEDDTRVQARGTFDGSHEAVLRNAVRDGKAGVDVLTPLRLDDGRAVLVDRGFVRASPQHGVTTAPPPTGSAVVHGLARESNTILRADSVDHLVDGRLAVPRVDIDTIGKTLPYRLLPVWIEAQAISPAPTGNAPALPEPPAPDPVNHLEYAFEWFAFALIPIIGWPIALRRFLRQRNAATNPKAESTASTEPVTSRNGRVGSRESNP